VNTPASTTITSTIGNSDLATGTIDQAIGAFLTPFGNLQIRSIDLDDPSIAGEACRWTTGSRGEPLPLDASVGIDLAVYVRAAMSIGTQMLGHASDASITGLASQVTQIAERAESASAALVRSAGEAAAQTTAIATRASQEASQATARVLAGAMKQFEQDAQRTLNARVAVVDERLNTLLAGESSEVATSVRQVISTALIEGQAGWQTSATATLTEMQRIFDPANPANPLAAATRQIGEMQQRHHAELGARIDRVTELVAATAGAATSAAALALWAFIGLESATVPAEEVKDPERTIPRATVLGTLLASAVYSRRASAPAKWRSRAMSWRSVSRDDGSQLMPRDGSWCSPDSRTSRSRRSRTVPGPMMSRSSPGGRRFAICSTNRSRCSRRCGSPAVCGGPPPPWRTPGSCRTWPVARW